MSRLGLLGGAIVAIVLSISACAHTDATVQFGDARRGKQLIEGIGCGACHVIGGIRSARGEVGPPLTGMARRSFIAGELPNNPANMVRWIQDPQAVEPNTAMPNLGIDERAARDIAAYLYTLR